MPEKLVAETQALRKKTNSIRGTAGLKRKVLIKEITKQRKQSTNRLEYMDPTVHPQKPQLDAEAAPPPAEEVAPPPTAEAA